MPERLRRALSPAAPARVRWLTGMALSTPLFLAMATVAVGGLASDAFPADVNHYHDFARKMRDGLLPYDDFTMEYPPFALPVFLAPLAFGDAGYVEAFKWLMALAGLATLAVVGALLVRQRATTLHYVMGLLVVGLSPLLLGHVYLNRYDPWAALLGVLALAGLLGARGRVAATLLALGIAAKTFPAAALPIAAIRRWRCAGRPTAVRDAAVFVAVCLAVFGPFAVIAFGGLGFSYYLQATRLLELQSLGGSLLMLADEAGVYETRIVTSLSVDLGGTVADAVAAVSTGVSVLAILAISFAYLKGPEDAERLIVAFSGAVVAFVAFSKVISPQFLIWLVPLVPLVAGRTGLAAGILFVPALFLTQIVQHGFEGFGYEPWVVGPLLLRNGLLIALFGVLLASLLGWTPRLRRTLRG